jgi:hypothetical protein
MDFHIDDHTHNLVTRRFITGILVILNNMPIRWISEHQMTVETSIYGSDIVGIKDCHRTYF